MRCQVCSMWGLKDPPDALSMEERIQVIDQLPDFEAPVHVVVTGGEPFTKPNDLLSIAKRLQSQGNSVGVVTSGIMLTPTVVDRLVDSGINHIAFSLDFPSPEQHDAQRGLAGTYNRIVQAIKRLTELRAYGRNVPTVGINSILMSQNLNYVEDLARLASDLGVSEMLFQPIHPDFAIDDSVSLIPFSNWLPMNPKRVDQALDRLEELRADTPLGQTMREFKLIRRYFRNPLELPPGSCQSAIRNLIIDVSGRVFHCFGQGRTGIPALGSVPRDNLVQLWMSESARIGRAKLARCTLGCGALLCHSRSSIPSSIAERRSNRLQVVERQS